MKAFVRFFGKEITEFVRTWRLPVLGGMILFFAVSGPPLAQFMPEILKATGTGQSGVVISMPEPTWMDAYVQWIKNLSQLIAFVMVIAVAGTVASEVSSGTAAMVVTKPVSRASFVLAKWAAFVSMLVGIVVVCTGVTQAITFLLFDKAPSHALWAATWAWLTYAAILVAIGVLFSCVTPTLAAAALTLGAFFLISIATIAKVLVRYTPVGLAVAPDKLLVGQVPAMGWPLATGAVLLGVLLAGAAISFSRRQL